MSTHASILYISAYPGKTGFWEDTPSSEGNIPWYRLLSLQYFYIHIYTFWDPGKRQ